MIGADRLIVGSFDDCRAAFTFRRGGACDAVLAAESLRLFDDEPHGAAR
jgi:hypothetical protein